MWLAQVTTCACTGSAQHGSIFSSETRSAHTHCAGLRLVRVRVDPVYPIDLIYLNRSKDMLLAEELATGGSLSNKPQAYASC